MLFKEKMNFYSAMIEKNLDRFFPNAGEDRKTITEASRYSLLGGGKRIRPILCLSVGELFNTPIDELMPFACAVEMIHTFSLIHDDLPCMDNDDYRRGNLTSHKMFGEGIAVLAGDALANKPYEIMLHDCILHPRKGKIEAAYAISAATGENGMIGGQTVDLESEHQRIPYEQLKRLHAMKTGALIKAPILAACFISQTSCEEKDFFEKYADAIGLAFQIKDDILDVTSNRETMGKTAGKDFKMEKSTYVSLFGLQKAGEYLADSTEQAFYALQKIKERGYHVEFLEILTEYLLKRIN
jgi:geranylgeranyl diphosphate synthase type II